MRVGLFVPCYIDQFYPQVAWATVKLLREHGCTVDFPLQQTCCGQPMANTGCNQDTKPLALRFFEIFRHFDYVVCPSGSCVSMVRNHYEEYFESSSGFADWKEKVFEVCEFLTDILQVAECKHPFPFRVGLHSSCHGLRELRLDACSERMGNQPSKVRHLLEMVPQIQLVEVSRHDECCGFGGTFAVNEESVSVRMGQDRLADHLQSTAQIMAATDMSCLMHMEGIARRQNSPIQFMHVVEILAGNAPNQHGSPGSTK